MSDVLYIHLADDGGIFLVWRESGREAWLSQPRLIEELDNLRAHNGTILYSLDPSPHPPPAIVVETLNLIKDYCLPMIVSREPHPRSRREENSTTLMAAAYAGNDRITEDLVGRGSNLETKDIAGYTALMYACNKGNDRIAKTLLSAGADPNARAADNSTPLMFAAQHGHADIVRQLIAAGADPSAKGDHGLSALGFAEQNGHIEIAQYLKSITASESLKST